MRFKHTPAPWRLHNVGSEYHYPYIVRGIQGGFQVMGLDQESQDADAKLISTAPELLEALVSLVDNEKQGIFESWVIANCPAGDCESVYSAWLTSSSYEDFCSDWEKEIQIIEKATM